MDGVASLLWPRRSRAFCRLSCMRLRHWVRRRFGRPHIPEGLDEPPNATAEDISLGRLVLTSDVRGALWVRQGLHDLQTGHVGVVVPDQYEAYVRILHPARGREDRARLVRWSEVAGWTKQDVNASTSFEDLLLPPLRGNVLGDSPRDIVPPREGVLHPVDLQALLSHLRGHTRTADECWFGVWDGYGQLSAGASGFLQAGQVESDAGGAGVAVSDIARVVRLVHADRKYLVLRGPLEAVSDIPRAFSQDPLDHLDGPNLWWPDDRSWVVGSEIDLDSTYVAGSLSLIQAIMADPRLETVEVSSSDALA